MFTGRTTLAVPQCRYAYMCVHQSIAFVLFSRCSAPSLLAESGWVCPYYLSSLDWLYHLLHSCLFNEIRFILPDIGPCYFQTMNVDWIGMIWKSSSERLKWEANERGTKTWRNTGLPGENSEAISYTPRDRVHTYRPVRARTICAKKHSTTTVEDRLWNSL